MDINLTGTKFTKIASKTETKKSQIAPSLKQKPDEFKTEKKRSFKEKLAAFWKKTKGAIIPTMTFVLGVLGALGAMNKRNQNIEKENRNLHNDNRDLKAENESLNQKKNELQLSKKELEEEKRILSERLEKISLPENYEERVQEKIEEVSSKADSVIKNETKNDDLMIISIPSFEFFTHKMSAEPEQTNNRANMIDLKIPEFIEGKAYSFAFPESEEIKTTHEKSTIKPFPMKSTNISEAYASSLNWDNSKISRDLLQNFFDGHGQTLDGVKFDVKPNQDGSYKVRLEGKSTFAPTKAILLGESSKKEDKHAAGQFGEGLKMIALKLLVEKGAEKVNVGSDNWLLSWQLPESKELDGKKVLSYQLDECEPFNGNYIEFNTNNEDLIKSIIDTFNNFYHSNNPSFKCPQFENEKLGVRILDKNEKGKMFISGQAFQVNGSYEGLEGIEIFLKEKPPVEDNGKYIFDPSRDRTSLNTKNIEAIGQWLAKRENLSDDDYVKLIHTLEPYWEVRPQHDKSNEAARDFLAGLLDQTYAKRPGILINFPDKKCIADAYGPSETLKQFYKDSGYKICTSKLGFIGMKPITDLINEARAHKELEPTEVEKKKILLLKDAIKLLAPKLKELNLFNSKELDPQIKVFDKMSELEDDSYKRVMAEAIVSKGESIGFWVDREHLKSSFTTMLSTALHELTHKYGGDESPSFSYKLTDVLESVLESITTDSTIAKELKILEGAWAKLAE